MRAPEAVLGRVLSAQTVIDRLSSARILEGLGCATVFAVFECCRVALILLTLAVVVGRGCLL